MLFAIGFLSAIVMICIFSLIVHSLRWIQDTFQGTIIAIHAVEVETNDYSLKSQLDNLDVQRKKLKEAIEEYTAFEKTYNK